MRLFIYKKITTIALFLILCKNLRFFRLAISDRKPVKTDNIFHNRKVFSLKAKKYIYVILCKLH